MESSKWAIPSSKKATQAPAVEPDTIPDTHAAPSYSDPEDAFAQTRGADDLFDDDFTPIRQSIAEHEPPQSAETHPRAPAAASAPISIKGVSRGPRASGRGRGRGRGLPTQKDAINAEAEGTQPSNDTDTPTSPKESKPAAVRGDRSGTGGIKKERLTDAELEERMRSMSLKNAALQAAHERAQQDEAAFAAREAAAAERRRADRQNRAQMMGERERNRMRKLQAVGGREWDAEKKGEDDSAAAAAAAGRGGRARRGAHGAVVGGARHGPAVPRQQEEEEAAEGASRRTFAERGRGRGKGRGGARGGRHDHTNQQQEPLQHKPQAPPRASDFPELPASSAPKEATPLKPPTKLEFPNAKPKEKPTQPQAEAPKEKNGDGAAGEQERGYAKKWEDAKRDFGLAALQAPGSEKESWADQLDSPT